MHWAYKHAEKLKNEGKEPIVIAAGTSPSGTVHIGNFRDIVTSFFITRALKNIGVEAKLLFSWDDYDRLRKVPKNISADKLSFYNTQIGKPYSEIPSPYDDGLTYAQHYEKEYENALEEVGIVPDIIRYQSNEYKSGRYIKPTIEAVKKRKQIYDILSRYRTQGGSDEERENYYPLNVYCECCGKDNTTIISSTADGKLLTYKCDECERDFTIDLSTQINNKLLWKIDWPMRWKEEGVDLEPGGKDHGSPQGSYTVSKDISKEIFGYNPPQFLGYEFIGIKGLAGKMSGSSGINISLAELLKVYTPEMILWMYAKKEPNEAFNIDLGKDVPRLYREFDKFIEKCKDTPELMTENDKQIIELIDGKNILKRQDVISFDKLVTVYGIAGKRLDVMAEILRKLGNPFSNTPELKERLSKAIHWAEIYSPESIIKINEEPNTDYYDTMTNERKGFIHKFLKGLTEEMTEEEIMTMLYDIPKKSSSDEITSELKTKQKTLFRDLYNLILSQDRGPMLSTLVKATGTKKIKEVIEPLQMRDQEEDDDIEHRH